MGNEATAKLLATLGVDTSAYEKSMANAGAKTEDFSKKFNNQLRDTRGAVKDVAGSIDGLGRAFDGSISGAVGGLRDLMQLIPVAPWAAMAAAAAAGFSAIAKYSENVQVKISEDLEKSLANWKRFRDEAKNIGEENAALERKAAMPESPSTAAVDFAMKEKEAATAAYEQEIKRNEAEKKRIADIRDAKRLIDEYTKAFQGSQQRALRYLDPKGKDATGVPESTQRSRLEDRGELFPPEIIKAAATQYNQLEELDAKSRRDLEQSKNKKLKAEERHFEELKKYEAMRQKDTDKAASEAKTKAEKDQRELNDRVMAVMEEGYREQQEALKKKLDAENKLKEENAKLDKAANKKRASLLELGADVRQKAADIFSKDRTSIFDKGDAYQRMGGQVGNNLDPALRQADIQKQVRDELIKLGQELLPKVDKLISNTGEED